MESVSIKAMIKDDIENFISEINDMGGSISLKDVESGAEKDFSFEVGDNRYRGNIFMYIGKVGISLRRINKKIKTIEELGLPKILKNISNIKDGLVIFTGPTGSGKSSTWASIIENININQRKHIVTIEDPIEHIFENKLSLITQREVSIDSESFFSALKYVLRQDPDIVVIGEIRDMESLRCAIRVAQTGHLCISTMHTIGSSETINRILGMFDSEKIEEVRMDIASVLRVVVSQRLIYFNGEVIPVVEFMQVDSSIRNLIRDGKIEQIDLYVRNSSGNMTSMDDELFKMYMEERIDTQTAINMAVDGEGMRKNIGGRGFI